MSTDDERSDAPSPAPRTRAEMRAAREAAERDAAVREAAAQDAAEAAARDAAAREAAAKEAAAKEAAAREAAAKDAAAQEAAAKEAAARDAAAARAAAFREAEERVAAKRRAAREGAATASAPASAATAVETPASASDATAPDPDQHDQPRPSSARRGGSAAPASADAPRGRRFGLALAAVLGVLVLAGAGLGFVSLTQGPRITNVQVDPQHAIESSGSRLILTANQSLAAIDPAQVTVEPAVPFTVDASGRGVGVRFTVPLDDATTYTVKVAGVTGTGGGPKADLVKSFTTPASTIFLLKRDVKGKDKIFRTDLSGEKAVPVFEADKIDDFRVTSTRLVVSVEEKDVSKLLVMDRDGKNERELPLPGVGYISGGLQVSERGGLVGYTYSDRDLSDTQGRASVLITQSLSGDDKPQIAEVGGKEANILSWQFVPDSSAVLFIDFDGALSLVDHSTDAGVQSLGLAARIQGVSRGTYTAVVERVDGSVVELDLADGSEKPLPASNPDYGTANTITPFPGGTLRHVTARDDTGMPIGQAVIRVADDGTATSLVDVGADDGILQACASPSGQYAAVAIAPKLTDNAYDQMLLPLPQNIETHLLDLRTGKELVALTGFDASWCQTPPQF